MVIASDGPGCDRQAVAAGRICFDSIVMGVKVPWAIRAATFTPSIRRVHATGGTRKSVDAKGIHHRVSFREKHAHGSIMRIV
ncbi:hypothetical protein [Pseudoxanthomonas putridarboris]|uniref:Uncharacterized protein n=1 Tax=Pseudoxanthomonas putridarboris TaxID=752605 RepID=A0ABU9J1N9_9GAMM